jgi:hypothetical protein
MTTIGPVALDVSAGVIQGRIDQVPAGAARTLTVRAYDAQRHPVYEGSATVNVVAGQYATANVVLARNPTYCPDAPVEPTATKATCAAFTQVAGPAITNAAPAAGSCPVPVTDASTPELAAAVAPSGAQTVGTSVQFVIPANTAGFTIVLQGVSVPAPTLPVRDSTGVSQIDNTAVPLKLSAPDGTVWYDDTQALAADGGEELVFFGSSSPLVGSLNVPNTSRGLTVVGTDAVPTGTWTLVVSDYAYECATVQSLSSQCGPQAALTPAPDFNAYRSGMYRTSVILRPGARPAQATMNVGLYVTRCPGAEYDNFGNCCAPTAQGVPLLDGTGHCTQRRQLTAANAASGQDPDAKRFVTTLASLLANGGICLGTVTWYDLPDWAQTKWSAGLDLDATSCDAKLEQLLTLSQPVAGGQMNLFLMPDLLAKSGNSTTQIVGIDGAIPGPATFSGTVQSGAAVSAANLRDGASACTGGLSLACGADVTAYIGAHESGHYLGLYHTTESSGDAFDPISDTLPCQCRSCLSVARASQCGTSSAQVTGTDCNKSTATCGGGSNLMFWLLDSVSAGKVSPQQSEVMLSSPLVH